MSRNATDLGFATDGELVRREYQLGNHKPVEKSCMKCGLTRDHNAPDECDHCAGSLWAAQKLKEHIWDEHISLRIRIKAMDRLSKQ